MTDHIQLPDIPTVVQANADGSQKIFAFPFPIFHDSDVEIRVGASVVTTGFTVFGAGSSKGGAVAFATAPAAGNRVTLRRKQVYARTEDFLDERAPTPHELNDAVDQTVAAIQELAEQSSRSVQRPLSADLSQPVSLELPTPEAGKLLGWNGSANGLANIAQVDTSDVLLKSQNLADLPDKAQARINLGLGSAATHGEGDFATAAQGGKADSALQSSDIGVSVQAHDADLDWVAANLSSAGRALIDDADASAQRTTLGLAAVAASGSYTDLSNKPSLGSAAALNVDTDVTLAANSDSLLPSQKAVKAYASNGSNISTGTVAAARLGVATASTSGALPTPPNNTATFLRGDATWAAVSAGSTAFVSTTSIGTGTSVTINTQFQAGYDYIFLLNDVWQNSGANTSFCVQFGTGTTPTIQTTNYLYNCAYTDSTSGGTTASMTSTASGLSGNSTANIQLNIGSTSAASSLNGKIEVLNPTSSYNPTIHWQITEQYPANGYQNTFWGGGQRAAGSGAITALKFFLYNGGNFGGGTITVLSVKKS